jgi:dimethylhistidine N-methyltransferase
VIIEPGAGSCEKIRHLLADIEPRTYIPVDISADYLHQAAEQLHREFPSLDVLPVAADFSQDFELPDHSPRDKRLLFYPGSTIGNFTPDQAVDFLQRCAGILGTGGGLLIGVDLHKDSATLSTAYNDSAGLTAAFNRNILNHANRILGANFEPAHFEHNAFYNDQERRIEMHLVSTRDQVVEHASGSLQFTTGASIHTEFSHKYSRQNFGDLLKRAGFVNRGYWSDEQEWFSVQYFEVI